MDGRQNADFSRKGPKIAGSSSVHADALLDHAFTDQLLAQRSDRFFDFFFAARELARLGFGPGQRRQGGGGGDIGGLVAISLDRDLHGLIERLRGVLLDRREYVVAVVDDGCIGEGLTGAGELYQLLLERDRLADPLFGRAEPVGDDFLGDLRRAGLVVAPGSVGATRFNHHDGNVSGVLPVGDLTPGYHQLKRRGRAFGVGGMGDPITFG